MNLQTLNLKIPTRKLSTKLIFRKYSQPWNIPYSKLKPSSVLNNFQKFEPFKFLEVLKMCKHEFSINLLNPSNVQV